MTGVGVSNRLDTPRLTKRFAAVLAFALSCSCATLAEEAPEGILPIPNYGAEFSNRDYLTGDWGGTRTEWANKGLQLDIDSVQWADTVVRGGKSDRSELGGTFQYNLKWVQARASGCQMKKIAIDYSAR